MVPPFMEASCSAVSVKVFLNQIYLLLEGQAPLVSSVLLPTGVLVVPHAESSKETPFHPDATAEELVPTTYFQFCFVSKMVMLPEVE